MALSKSLISNPSHRQLQQAGYTWDEKEQGYFKDGNKWQGEAVEAYGQAATGGEYLQRTKQVKKEMGGVFAAPQPEPSPELPVTSPVTQETALPDGWHIDTEGNAISDSGWKVTQDQKYFDPQGKEWTDTELKESEQLVTDLGGLFPNQDIDQLITWADTDPQKFVDEFRSIGDTAASRSVLKRMGMSDQDIDVIFMPEQETKKSPFALIGQAWQSFLDTEWGTKPAQVEFNPERGNSLQDIKNFPGKLMEWLAPTKVGAALNVVGSFFENLIDRPWEATVILASHALSQMAIGTISTAKLAPGVEEKAAQYASQNPNAPSSQAYLKSQQDMRDLEIQKSDQILADAVKKYGVGAFFSDEVSESWNVYKEEQMPGFKKVVTAEEWLNPAYLIPIGEVVGQAANFTSKIPIIGKALKYSAAAVQATEKGLTYIPENLAKAGFRGLEQVGAKLGEAATDQLLKGSKHLEDIMDLPTSDMILDETLKDNWQRRLINTIAKVPGAKKVIETGLGRRVLISRTAEDILDTVGRGAVVHGEMTRRGANAAAAKVLELRSVTQNPVKFFGFDDKAISEGMKARINPYYKGIPEAGTLEHVFSQPQLYNWTGFEEGLRYVGKFREVQGVMYNLLVKEGVPPEHVIEDWVHRVVQDAPKAKNVPKVRPGGGGRIGAKPAYEKPRRFDTMADGIKYFSEHPELGKRYANNPELLIRDYIQQAFKKIADGRFEKYVEKLGTTAKEIMEFRFPRESAAWTAIKKQVADLGYISSAIKRVKRGESLPGAVLAAIERRDPALYQRLVAAIGDKEALKNLGKEVTTAIEALKPEWWKGKGAYTHALELARQPAIGMGYLPQPFAGGKMYTQEFLDAFKTYFEQKGGHLGFQITSEMSGILRTMKASLDVSAMAIQGMPAFGLAFSHLVTNPAEGMKMMGSWFKGFGMSAAIYFDPSIAARYINQNSKSVMQRLAMGGSEMVSDYLISAESRISERLSTLPFYDRANLSFCTATEVVRDEFWKILSPKAIANGKGFDLARTLDRITGVFNSEAAGISLTARQLENSFVWFAPNYTRSCLSVLSDIFRGGFTGAEARKAIGGMIAAGGIMYGGVQYAMSTLEGKSHEQSVDDVMAGFGLTTDPITGESTWKPTGQFMTIKVGNYNFGIGGFWYGLLRLSGNITACVNKTGGKEPIDLIRIMKDGAINIRDNPFINWWYSRSSPVVGTGFELLSGKNYLGYPIETPKDYALYIATRFEPIWAEQGINPWIPVLARGNEVPEGAARAAVIPAEVFGLRTFPESSWVKFYDKGKDIINGLPEDILRDYYSDTEIQKVLDVQGKGKLEWSMLPDALQIRLRTMYPELETLYSQAQTDSTLRDSDTWKNWQTQMDETKKIYYDRGNALIQRYKSGELTGQQFRDAWSEAGMMYGTSLDTIERDPANKVIYDYLAASSEGGDKYNWSMNSALQQYISIAFSDWLDENGEFDFESRQQAIDGFIETYGRSTYETVKKMYDDKKLLGGLDPALIQLASDKEKLSEYWDIDPKDTKARQSYRQTHPEIDAILGLWGYGGKVQSTQAYDVMAQKANELGLNIDKMQTGLPPQSLMRNYFDYQALDDATARKQYRKANPLFDEWGQVQYGWKDIDTQKVAATIPDNIQKYLDAYNKLPLGKARKQYRIDNPDFDAYLVKEKGYKPAK